MATIVLDVQDESLLTQIKKACQLLKGVASVKVQLIYDAINILAATGTLPVSISLTR